MGFRRIIAVSLACLAVIGLMFAPSVGLRSANAMQSLAAEMTGDEMPCCPTSGPAMPDCQKGCPLASICLAKCVTNLVSAIPVTSPVDLAADNLVPAKVGGNALSAPELPPRPPRT